MVLTLAWYTSRQLAVKFLRKAVVEPAGGVRGRFSSVGRAERPDWSVLAASCRSSSLGVSPDRRIPETDRHTPGRSGSDVWGLACVRMKAPHGALTSTRGASVARAPELGLAWSRALAESPIGVNPNRRINQAARR